MAKPRKKEECKGGEGWLTTYGDMVTLLLTFFVFLFSFSTIDISKFEKMIFSFQGSLGMLQGGLTFNAKRLIGMGFTGQDAGAVMKHTKYLQEVMKQIKAFLSKVGAKKGVFVRKTEVGIVITFSETILFDPGSATLKRSAFRILRGIARILVKIPNDIRVEGHTDDIPIHTKRYPTNWDLSAARALAVTRYLVNNHFIDPRRISVAGYGAYKPIVPNDTPQHRALNRRVDIVILKTISLGGK